MTNKEHKKTFKAPKTIELKTLIPYALLATLILVIGTAIATWFAYQSFESSIDSRIKAEVQQVVSLKADQ